MPVIKSAKKKLRKDILREKRNNAIRIALKKALKDVKKKSSSESVKNAVKLADKAAKNNIIHKNNYYKNSGRFDSLMLLIEIFCRDDSPRHNIIAIQPCEKN